MGNILKGINGERFPVIGNVKEYNVTFSEGFDITSIKDDEILWQVYWATGFSEYEKVPFSGQKKGRKATYKFLQNLLNKNLQIKATYKDETVELHVTPQANGEVKIIDVFFTDLDYKILQDSPKYLNSVNLQIYTLNMLGKAVEFKIYNTANGQDIEVAKSREPLVIVQKNGIVKTKSAVLLHQGMAIQTQQNLSAEEHQYKVKVWESGKEDNFYEEELKVKNESGSFSVPKNAQSPVKTGTSETVKPKEKTEDDKKCFCQKEFSEDDIKSFYNSKKLFTHKLCPLPENQKTYAEFTKALNTAMNLYDINTCLRKAHFLAQVQVESDSLNTTIEYANGWDYDYSTHLKGYNEFKPYANYKKDKKLSAEIHKKYTSAEIKKLQREYNRYFECLKHKNDEKGDGPKYKGKGLLQITWKDTYIAYFDYIKHPEYLPNPDIVAKNITNACDASAWYWKFHSIWGNLNLAADRDDIYYISIGVNGGFNHFDVRIKNVKKILELMKVKERCKNISSLEKDLAKYKYSTSKMKEKQYGKDHKSTFEKYDDK
ncbi:glycoside hydrolase family 19 protein [Kaistella jeonii]|uniref:Glycoside hydrolase family 19 catalytic domain-containing protein n=1 Tax=Kaistella jeonii TaxID=266749 RepID=A0A0C1ERX9_9FLAO|nr:hypothetical protein [Kaistella jeonii]KIA82623.1 hypothetical protein OA86_15000 [Kaistella jeonii]SFC45331.1 Predicted chitinase [Kaistella jeonii]VEI96506.1 Predicted chitinase [Kaistella jeonii]